MAHLPRTKLSQAQLMNKFAVFFDTDQDFFQQRLNQVKVDRYEKTRNSLDGSVTYLSPYITHGFEALPAIVRYLKMKHSLNTKHKLYAELGWREYFQHVWGHLGNGIFEDIRPAIPGISYCSEMPLDILTANTGIATIDRSIQMLYNSGYLHNHARMWLASYCVHYRKIAWLPAAQWLYGHLLDGDLASNHLSWQWVARTFSSKPYLFNAANVAKYASVEWHSQNTPIDTTYEVLEKLAFSPDVMPHIPRATLLQDPVPELFTTPPTDLVEKFAFIKKVDPKKLLGKTNIALVHPWNLKDQEGPFFQLGIIDLGFHQRFAWSRKRWEFVLTRMKHICRDILIADLSTTLIPLIEQNPHLNFEITQTYNPSYFELIKRLEVYENTLVHPVPRFLDDPENLCPSFSKFWQQVTSKNSYPRP